MNKLRVIFVAFGMAKECSFSSLSLSASLLDKPYFVIHTAGEIARR